MKLIPRDRTSAIERIAILSDIYYQVFNHWPDDRITAWCDRNQCSRNLSEICADDLWRLANSMQKKICNPESKQKISTIYGAVK